jgi:hypothetical protein
MISLSENSGMPATCMVSVLTSVASWQRAALNVICCLDTPRV